MAPVRPTNDDCRGADEPRRLAYTMVRGIPVRNYRAEVTLTPVAPEGTSVRWTATWDGTFMGRMVHRRLQQVYQQAMTALVAAANHKDALDRQKAMSLACRTSR